MLNFLYVMDKALTGKLSCMQTGLVSQRQVRSAKVPRYLADFVQLTMFVATGPRPEMLKF